MQLSSAEQLEEINSSVATYTIITVGFNKVRKEHKSHIRSYVKEATVKIDVDLINYYLIVATGDQLSASSNS